MKIKMRPELALIKDIKPQRGPTAETAGPCCWLSCAESIEITSLIE